MTTGYVGLPDGGGTPRDVARTVNRINQGKFNATLDDVTLVANQATTTLTDARLTGSSWIGFMQRSANAAAELGNGTMYVSARGKGTATITHANNAQTDRTFTLLIIG